MKKLLAVFCLSLSLSILTYFPSLSLFFFSDDFVWFSQAQTIVHNWSEICTLEISHFFMPIIYTYFTFAWHTFGTNPAPYYLVNILLHSVNGFLLFILAKRLSPTNTLPALAAMIFFVCLASPMESIVWISAITVLITAFFLLLAGHSWISFLETKKRAYFALTVILALLLILTKEWFVLLLPFLLLISYLFYCTADTNQKSLKQILVPLRLFFLLTVGYLVFQWWIQSQGSPLIEKEHYVFGFHAVKNILHNLILVFFPLKNLIIQHPALTTLAGIGLAIGVFFLEKKFNWTSRPITSSLIFLMIAFVPTASFTWDPYISRYTYLPAIGASLMCFFLFKHLQTYKIPQKVFFILIIIYSAINIFFVHRVIHTVYLPVHQEIRAFIFALSQPEIDLKNTEYYGFFPPFPILDFVIPDALQATFSVEKTHVKIYSSNDACEPNRRCLRWNSKTKTIQEIPKDLL